MWRPRGYELTPQQWSRTRDVRPGKPGDPGRCGADDPTFVTGVLWVWRSGAQGHDWPARYGAWKTAHKRFTRWAKAGVWERLFEHLMGDRDDHHVSIGSSRVRAHQQAATGQGGGQEGGIRPWGAAEEDRPARSTGLWRRPAVRQS